MDYYCDGSLIILFLIMRAMSVPEMPRDCPFHICVVAGIYPAGYFFAHDAIFESDFPSLTTRSVAGKIRHPSSSDRSEQANYAKMSDPRDEDRG